MGVGVFFHYLGTVLLLAATALLIVADISAPVVNQLAIFTVDLGGNSLSGSEVNFGTFGWCIRNAGSNGDSCSDSRVGYNVAELISDVDGTNFSGARETTTRGLTHVMVLHAVATGIIFIAFLLSFGTGMLMSLLATFTTAFGFVITAVALICDFIGFNLIRRAIRDDDESDSSGHFGPAAWCVLAAGILSLIATILLFITCCAGRRQKKHQHQPKMETWNGEPPVTTPHHRRSRFHFWQRRSAY